MAEKIEILLESYCSECDERVFIDFDDVAVMIYGMTRVEALVICPVCGNAINVNVEEDFVNL